MCLTAFHSTFPLDKETKVVSICSCLWFTFHRNVIYQINDLVNNQIHKNHSYLSFALFFLFFLINQVTGSLITLGVTRVYMSKRTCMLLTHGKKYLNLLSFKNVSKFIPFKFEEFQNNAWIRNSNEIEQVTIK